MVDTPLVRASETDPLVDDMRATSPGLSWCTWCVCRSTTRNDSSLTTRTDASVAEIEVTNTAADWDSPRSTTANPGAGVWTRAIGKEVPLSTTAKPRAVARTAASTATTRGWRRTPAA